MIFFYYSSILRSTIYIYMSYIHIHGREHEPGPRHGGMHGGYTRPATAAAGCAGGPRSRANDENNIKNSSPLRRSSAAAATGAGVRARSPYRLPLRDTLPRFAIERETVSGSPYRDRSLALARSCRGRMQFDFCLLNPISLAFLAISQHPR